MSKDNLGIIERKTIEQLVNELDFLNAQIFAKIHNDTDGGLIKNLNDLLNEIDKTKNKILKSETSVYNNLIILKKILKKIELSESTSELRLINTNDQFQKEIRKIKNELIEDFKKKVEEINEKINTINLRTIEVASNNTITAINRLNTFYTTTKDINNNLQSKLKITSLILSFMGGSILTSIFFYFFI